MQNPSSKFLYKYLIFTLILLSALYLKKQFFAVNYYRTANHAFFDIDKQKVDSLLAGLSDSLKINFLLGENTIYIDSIDYNQINDTVFLKEYFDYHLSTLKDSGFLFYLYYPAKSVYAKLNDTAYFNFIKKRYELIDKIAEKNGMLAGWVYQKHQQKQLEELCDSTSTKFTGEKTFLETKIKLHVFNDKSITHTHFRFKGLKICNVNTEDKDLEK